jgi:hypothetical protein
MGKNDGVCMNTQAKIYDRIAKKNVLDWQYDLATLLFWSQNHTS